MSRNVTVLATDTNWLRQLRDHLGEGLVERDVAIRLALLAALSGEHLLLIGPPGTAKSMVARRLHEAFADAPYFERLLTRFSVPEELFGPLSIKQLEQDRYQRLTEGYLPTAAIAFLDEIFKANSAILNALLTLLNEREFDNGVDRVKVPLVTVVAASNELPEGEELHALYDRFLLRLHVRPVSDAGFASLLGMSDARAPLPPSLRLGIKDLLGLRELAERVAVPSEVIELLKRLRTFAAREGIVISDRRWRKIVGLLKASAATCGRAAVSVWDGWLLQHVAWERPEHSEVIFRWYLTQLGADAGFAPDDLETMVAAYELRLERDRARRAQVQDKDGAPLYRGHNGNPTRVSRAETQKMRGGERLFLGPADARGISSDRGNGGKGYTVAELDEFAILSNHQQFRRWDGRTAYLADRSNWLMEDPNLQPLMEPMRFSMAHLGTIDAELTRRLEAVRGSAKAVQDHKVDIAETVKDHLWCTTDFIGPATEALDHVHARLDALDKRLQAVRKGFAALPREA